MHRPEPFFSIVVPTKNSAQDLPRLLTSLHRQTWTDFEVIVVDGGSTDGTRELALSYSCRVLHGGKAADSRNIGAKAGSGPVLLFLDSDMEVPPTLLATCARLIREYPVLYLREEVVSDSLWAKARGFEKRACFHSRFNEAPRCMLRSIFESLGGYDERFGNDVEDMELEARILEQNIFAGWVEEPPILHYEYGLGLARYLQKRTRRSAENSESPILLRAKHPAFWSQFSSPRRRLALLLRQLLREPTPRNGLYLGMVAFQRLLEYRARTGRTLENEGV